MIITVNSDGFITGYLTLDDMLAGNYEKIANTDKRIQCPNFPADQKKAWNHFKKNYRCYTFHPVAPEYWVENFGENYEIPSKDIVAQFVYHKDHEAVLTEEFRGTIREKRAKECFSVINRSQLWYDTLSDDQKEELKVWYQAWLDAPETLTIPEKPDWLN